MKKRLFTIINLLIFCQQIFGQEKIYFDKDWKQTSKENAAYFRKINKLGELYTIRDYFISGEKQFEGKSSTPSEPLSFDSTAIWYNKNGKILQKRDFKNNVLYGDERSYYADGTLKTSGHYIEGKLNSLYTEYFPSGDISAQGNFKDGKMDGISVKFKSPEKPDFKMNYKNGVVDGPYEFYNSNNSLLTKGNSKNNSQEGLCQEFFYDGELLSQYTIKNKKLDGVFIQFNKEKDTTIIAHFKDGKALDFTSKSLRTINGSKFNALMALNVSVENWTIYRDRKLIVKAFYENGRKTGLWKIYNYDGSKLIQTIDFGGNSLCQDKYIQETKSGFSPNFSLSDRFRFDDDILETKDCKNAIVKNLIENFDSEHPFYYRTKDGNKKLPKMLNKSNVLDYIEHSNKPEFISKNKCVKYGNDKKVLICVKEIDKIIHKVILSESVDSLKKIKASVNPKSNEIYFFYQQFESRSYDFNKEKRPNRYMAFTISKTLKEAFKDNILDSITVIGVYEHQFWNVDDFSGLAAYDAYEKEIEDIKNE
jgi:uncharacterized protein